MIVKKWVEWPSQEVEISIGVDDIRAALSEAFDVVIKVRLGEEGPSRRDIVLAINYIFNFLQALTDAQIEIITEPKMRATIASLFQEQADRFRAVK